MRPALLLAAIASVAFACSVEYPIWIPRTQTADPIYRFTKDGKAGYIDAKGNILFNPSIPFQGNVFGEFRDGLLKVSVLNLEGEFEDTFFDTAGNRTAKPEANPLGSRLLAGLTKFKSGNRFGFIDQASSIAIKPQFLEASDFSEGMASVVLAGPCIYFSQEPCGESNPIFLGLTDKSPAQKTRLQSCKLAFISQSGSVVGNLRFESGGKFSEGLAPVRIEGNWGFADKTGTLVIPAIYENAFAFSNGLARIRLNDRFGFIDKSGSLVIQPQFVEAEDFSGGLAPVQDESDRFHYINSKGEQAFPGYFALASPFFKGLAHVLLSGPGKRTYAYINTNGRTIFKYEDGTATDR